MPERLNQQYRWHGAADKVLRVVAFALADGLARFHSDARLTLKNLVDQEVGMPRLPSRRVIEFRVCLLSDFGQVSVQRAQAIVDVRIVLSVR